MLQYINRFIIIYYLCKFNYICTPMSHRVKILACSSSEPLAIEIAKSYGQVLGEVEVQKFSDGEFGVSLIETPNSPSLNFWTSTLHSG